MKFHSSLFLALGVLLFAACETAPQEGLTAVPKVIYQVPPQYPFELRKANVTGSAVVEFIINTNGDVVNAFAVAASDPRFGEAAVAAVCRWKFQPGIRNGRTVNTRLQVPIYFSLEDNPPGKAAVSKP